MRKLFIIIIKRNYKSGIRLNTIIYRLLAENANYYYQFKMMHMLLLEPGFLGPNFIGGSLVVHLLNKIIVNFS